MKPAQDTAFNKSKKGLDAPLLINIASRLLLVFFGAFSLLLFEELVAAHGSSCD